MISINGFVSHGKLGFRIVTKLGDQIPINCGIVLRITDKHH